MSFNANPAVLDVAREIILDHDNVRDLFERFKVAANVEEKVIIANTLIREIAIHSDAEEMSLYDYMGNYGLGQSAAHNREEHAEVKQLVYVALDAQVDRPDFEEIITRAVTTFLQHSQEEETQQLPQLVAALTPDQNDALAREFLGARIKVPSRLHPVEPEPELQESFHSKITDAMWNRQFTNVKFAHPEL
ncbi:hypothetical protein V5O48_008318 [Marasmius crinis-equi]|uniref:Hemerythrin-like domain-containing protein n=1 Tax=Marasmius crinis-equi TaxID=585013 RepID=A0ABR3FEA8_9AGAR